VSHFSTEEQLDWGLVEDCWELEVASNISQSNIMTGACSAPTVYRGSELQYPIHWMITENRRICMVGSESRFVQLALFGSG
jgi:hypothetical protein